MLHIGLPTEITKLVGDVNSGCEAEVTFPRLSQCLASSSLYGSALCHNKGIRLVERKCVIFIPNLYVGLYSNTL